MGVGRVGVVGQPPAHDDDAALADFVLDERVLGARRGARQEHAAMGAARAQEIGVGGIARVGDGHAGAPRIAAHARVEVQPERGQPCEHGMAGLDGHELRHVAIPAGVPESRPSRVDAQRMHHGQRRAREQQAAALPRVAPQGLERAGVVDRGLLVGGIALVVPEHAEALQGDGLAAWADERSIARGENEGGRGELPGQREGRARLSPHLVGGGVGREEAGGGLAGRGPLDCEKRGQHGEAGCRQRQAGRCGDHRDHSGCLFAFAPMSVR